MHSSSVLIVHPSADRFRLPDMANGKLNRHYSLDSPSLTSPPGYVSDQLIVDQKPTTFSMSMSMPTTTGMPIGSSPHQFPSFNPHLVMAPTGPPGLLHISKHLWHLTTFMHSSHTHSACIVNNRGFWEGRSTYCAVAVALQLSSAQVCLPMLC